MDINAPYFVGYIVGLLLVLAIALAVGSLIGAFFVQISTRIVAGFRPSYGKAWLTGVAVILASTIIRVTIAAILGVHLDISTRMLLLVGLCCVQASISGQMLEHPETGPIGFVKGLLVTFVQWVIGVICLVILILTLILCSPNVTVKSLFDPATYRNLQQNPALNSQIQRVAQSRTTRALPTPSPAVSQPVDAAKRVQESQREAVRLYPELGVAGSKFNKEFVARYTRYKQERPGYFRDPTWPVCLAQETDEALNPK